MLTWGSLKLQNLRDRETLLDRKQTVRTLLFRYPMDFNTSIPPAKTRHDGLWLAYRVPIKNPFCYICKPPSQSEKKQLPPETVYAKHFSNMMKHGLPIVRVVFIFKTHGTLSAFALRWLFLVPTRWRSSHKATAQKVKSSTNGWHERCANPVHWFVF